VLFFATITLQAGKKGIMMLCIIIIKLLGLCFKIENLFGVQFDKFEKIYINSHKKHCTLLIRVTTFIENL